MLFSPGCKSDIVYVYYDSYHYRYSQNVRHMYRSAWTEPIYSMEISRGIVIGLCVALIGIYSTTEDEAKMPILGALSHFYSRVLTSS